MIHTGGCHCGALIIAFESAKDPAQMPVRQCQCSFCRKHGTSAITDPEGRLTVCAREETMLGRYRFGLETAEYMICTRCGVYVAAVTVGEAEPRGIAILNALGDRMLFTAEPFATVYDDESRDERIERRRSTWTPARIEGLGASRSSAPSQ